MMYSPFRHLPSILWKKNPIHLTFFVTRRCNARCSFCFYQAGGDRDGGTSAELTVEEVEKVSSSIGKLLWLSFSGGEIFLRRDLTELVEVFYRNNQPSLIVLPTNGLLPDTIRRQTEAILEKCPRSTVVVKLSLDGTREVHDALRGVRGAFDRTLGTYRQLEGLARRHRNLELGVNTVFCAANQKSIDEVIDIVGGLDDIRTHTVSLIRGQVPDPALKEVDRERYLQILETMESDLRERPSCRYRFKGGRLKVAQDILQRRLIHETSCRSQRLVPCYAGRLSVVLDEEGDVYPCEILAARMGNVRDGGYDLKGILSSSEGRRTLDSIGRGNCYCTHECNFMMNIFFNPRLYPALFREYGRLLLGGAFRGA